MKRFLLFAGENFYPSGGWSDFLSDHDDGEAALSALLDLPIHTPSGQWAHIVDTETGIVTWFHGCLAREWKHGDKGQPWTERNATYREDDDE